MSQQTVGDIFRKTRKKKGLSLIGLSRATKIRIKLLRQLESNRYEQLPEGPARKGLIRNYAQALGLNPNNVLAIYRRDFESNFPSRRSRHHRRLPPSSSPTLKFQRLSRPIEFILTYWGYGLVILLIFLGFFAFQLRRYYLPPRLIVETPINGQVTHQASILVSGRTELGNQLTINSKVVIPNRFGQFADAVQLTEGVNRIELTVTGPQAKQNRKFITVYFEP